MKTINVQLKSEVQYSAAGEQLLAKFITITAPTSKHRRLCGALRQGFFQAMAEHQAKVTNDELEEIREAKAVDEKPESDGPAFTPEEVISMISMSTVVDYGKLLDTMADLLLTGVAKIDGEAKMTRHILDSMSQADFENITGEYYANFTL